MVIPFLHRVRQRLLFMLTKILFNNYNCAKHLSAAANVNSISLSV